MDGDSTSSGNARRRAMAPEPQRTHATPEPAPRPAPETEAPLTHGGAPSALLHDARLDARANGAVRAGLYIAMQRDYGNRAARRARDQARAGVTPPAAAGLGARRDAPEEAVEAHAHDAAPRADSLPAELPESPAQDAALAPLQAKRDDGAAGPDPNVPQVVQIPDGAPPAETGEAAHGPCDCVVCQRVPPPGAGSGSAAPAPAPAPPAPKHIEPGAITINWSQPNTLAAGQFGEESFKASHSGATATAAGAKVKLDFTIDLVCAWGVNSGGNTDVASGTDPAVTIAPHPSTGKKTYEQIAIDLTPSAADNWRPPRSFYWSQAFSSRHEKFHTTDDKAWANGAGKQAVVNFLKAKTVTDHTAVGEISTILGDAMTDMNNNNFQWYSGGGKPYIQRPGEMRAFADGKDSYTALAAAVRAQGRTLEAAAAAAAHAAPAGGGHGP
jgi:hypothetical protein